MPREWNSETKVIVSGYLREGGIVDQWIKVLYQKIVAGSEFIYIAVSCNWLSGYPPCQHATQILISLSLSFGLNL